MSDYEVSRQKSFLQNMFVGFKGILPLPDESNLCLQSEYQCLQNEYTRDAYMLSLVP